MKPKHQWILGRGGKAATHGLRVADTIVEAKKPPSGSHDNKNLRPFLHNRTSFNGKKIIRTYLPQGAGLNSCSPRTDADR